MKSPTKRAKPATVRVSVIMPHALWLRARSTEGIGTRGLTKVLVKLLQQYLKGAK